MYCKIWVDYMLVKENPFQKCSFIYSIYIYTYNHVYIYIYIYIYTLRLFTIQKQIIHILKNKMIPHIDYLSIMHLNLQI